MSKTTISLNFREQIQLQESDEVAIILIQLRHPDTSEVIYLSGDSTVMLASTPDLKWGTVSQSITYTYHPLSLRLPSDVQDKPPRMQLVVENVTGAMVSFCASMIQRGTCVLNIVAASDVNYVQIPFPQLDIRGYTRNSNIITFDIGIDAAEDEPIPAGMFTPAGFPGVFT